MAGLCSNTDWHAHTHMNLCTLSAHTNTGAYHGKLQNWNAVTRPPDQTCRARMPQKIPGGMASPVGLRSPMALRRRNLLLFFSFHWGWTLRIKGRHVATWLLRSFCTGEAQRLLFILVAGKRQIHVSKWHPGGAVNAHFCEDLKKKKRWGGREPWMLWVGYVQCTQLLVCVRPAQRAWNTVASDAYYQLGYKVPTKEGARREVISCISTLKY